MDDVVPADDFDRRTEPRMLGDIVHHLLTTDPLRSSMRSAGYDIVEEADGSWGMVEAPQVAS